MIGLVLAAGAGRRLRPYTDHLPKALLPVDGETTILDIALRNLAAVGLTDITVVVGYAAEAVAARQAALEKQYGVRLTLVHNDRAEEWNNAYSLWLAREHFAGGALLVNGDTVHPVRWRRPCWPTRGPGVLLAVDDVKQLADEEMKVIIDADRPAHPDHQADGPGRRLRRVHRRHAHRAARRRRARRRAGGDLAARPGPLLRGRLPGVRRPRRRGPRRHHRRRSTGWRSTTTPTSPGPGRSHAATSPNRHHAARTSTSAAARWPTSARSSPTGASRPAATWRSWSGPARASGSPTWCGPASARADVFTVAGGTLDAAQDLAAKLRGRSYDAVVGIGGGKTIDTAKYAATRYGIPMVSVATSLANDGIASPVSHPRPRRRPRLVRRAHPDRRRRRPRLRGERPGPADPGRHRRRGQQPQRARRLGAGPPGARRADRRPGRGAVARSAPRRCSTTRATMTDDGFVTAARRGADHRRAGDGGVRLEPAVQRRLPRDLARDRHDAPARRRCTASRSASARCSAPSCAATRRASRSSTGVLRRHGLPRLPADLGLTDEQFVEVVRLRPAHPAGPVHDPRAPRPRRGRHRGAAGGLRRCGR